MKRSLAVVAAGQRPDRAVAALFSVAAALGIAVGGALLTSEGAGGLNILIEELSSDSSRALGQIGELVPLGFAFAAGLVSAVNPCGFVLLPAYLGVFLGERAPEHPDGLGGRVVRGLVIGGVMTLAFLTVFLAVGLVVGSVAGVVVGAFPWLGLAVGAALVLAGGYRVAGGSIHADLVGRVSDRLAPVPAAGGLAAAQRVGWRAYFMYGLAYGIASLSCTLPIFLAVVGASLASAQLVPALGQLVLYGLGMGSLIVALTLAAALLKATALRRLRGATRVVQPAGTIFLFAAGAYVVYYWLTVGGLLTR